MNGTIGVTSKINQGSEFWIELSGDSDITPAIEGNSKADVSNPALNTETTLSHNILVAEDNPTNQTLILSQLETLGYEADLVKNGQEALNKLVNNSYQLLLTDCNMPLVDGYQLAKAIREKGNNKLPIIALTADAFPETKAKCLKSGMNDQITKPVDLITLKYTLEKYLNQET
jgi:CheY-like chemotaxis protein